MTGAELKILRKKYQLTQQELAEKIGTHKSLISRWENGKHHIGNAYLKVLFTLFESLEIR